ncbi:outer membrane beta-barrel protein [Larkinella terrae]|uniref:Outer membrane beta-barrel protein n=1 Tax=Larkinella terrae TaxID=2025311 RepID=A0A7K0EVJ2_9BACT|nr:outer membrane beta-barrel protein [Larkinella terrae]MRS65844.1 outer membrane beta-barrel protein [Larkinella terrae]
MSLSKEEQLNEEWRSIFENAEESPSEGLWDSISRRLDEEEAEPVIPLWPRAKPWVYSAAAAIITLLVGWWATQYIESTDTNRPVADKTVQSEQLAKTEKPSSLPANTSSNEKSTTGNTPETEEMLATTRRTGAGKNTSGTPTAPELERSETATTIDGIIKDQSALSGNRKPATTERRLARRSVKSLPKTDERLARLEPKPSDDQMAKRFPTRKQPLKKSTADRQLLVKSKTKREPLTGASPAVRVDETASQLADTRLAYEASFVKSKQPVSKNPAPISRIIWYRAPETALAAIEPQDKGRSKKEYWAALTATPMSFNPMAAVHSSLNQASVAYNSIQAASRLPSTTLLQNQAQISMAWQASSGVQFSKHWSVEAGIQYLNGRSQTQNNASVTNMFTNQTENVLVNAIRNSNTSLPLASSPAPANNQGVGSSLVADKNGLSNMSNLVVTPADQVVSNNFQYMQIPVQLGYHILPDRKISYSILGGLMANLFLKNTINGTLEVNPEDQIYRPMSMAGTAGLRVNYHPTHHWSGSLTGSYQQALQDGTESNAQLNVRPQAIGVGFGLNYHF